MNTYVTVKAVWADAPKRLSRKLLVREDLNLEMAGLGICTAFGAMLEHLYYFKDGKQMYYPEAFMEDTLDDDALCMNGVRFADLSDKFKVYYDTGEGYRFDCTKLKTKVDLDADAWVIVKEGKGAGIFEDNISSLLQITECDYKDEFSEDYDDETAIFKPFNLELEKPSDFDAPLDIDELNFRMGSYFFYNAEMEEEWEDEDQTYGDPSDPAWRIFHDLMNRKDEAYQNEDIILAWRRCFDEFFRVTKQKLGVRKTKMRYESFLDLVEYDSAIMDLFDEGIDELDFAAAYEEAEEYLNELEDLFEYPLDMQANMAVEKMYLFIHMKKAEAETALADSWMARYPKLVTSKLLRLLAYKDQKEYEEAIDFIESLNLDLNEIDDAKYPLYHLSAEILEESGKEKKLAKRLAKLVEEKDDADMRELMASLDDEDEIPF